MNRLTTDNPQSNSEVAMNFAYAKDGEVYLRIPHNHCEDYELRDYLCNFLSNIDEEQNIVFECSSDVIMQRGCADCLIDGGECPLGVLFVAATQAAELRGRLKKYEDAEENKPNLTGMTGRDERKDEA